MGRRHARLLALLLSSVALLYGCGSATPVAPTVAPMERPTSTPRPTVTPEPQPTATEAPTATEEPSPTAKTLPTDEPQPTTVTNPDDLAKVEISGLTDYTHPGGLFTVKIPDGWTKDDKSNPSVVAVTWADPANNALIAILVTEEEKKLSTDELGQRLQAFVDTSKEEPDFSADAPKTLKSGGVQVIWSYTATADKGVKAKLLINSFIYQDGNKVSILMLGVPDAQFDSLKSNLDDILNSYTVNPDAALAAPADDNLPDAVTYDFSDAKGKWITQSTGEVEAERTGGVYTMRISAPDQYYVSNPDMEDGTDQGIAANVEPSGDARAGVFLRFSKDQDSGKSSFYACWIDADSQYGCFVSIKGKWTVLQDATKSDAIKAGESNRIRMTVVGDQLSFSVNGQEIYTVTNGDLADAGKAGLYLENFKDPVEAIYDDVAISSK